MTLSTEASRSGYPSRVAATVRGERGPRLKKVLIGGTSGQAWLFLSRSRIASWASAVRRRRVDEAEETSEAAGLSAQVSILSFSIVIVIAAVRLNAVVGVDAGVDVGRVRAGFGFELVEFVSGERIGAKEAAEELQGGE